MELLAEAGNYAAFQRLYGTPYGAWPYAAAGAQGPPGAPTSAADLYYRQAAAAAALQKPLPYRIYPGVPAIGSLGGLPGPSGPFPHISASSSLTSLSNYYQNNSNNIPNIDNVQLPKRASPPLNPESSPTHCNSAQHSDDEDSMLNV